MSRLYSAVAYKGPPFYICSGFMAADGSAVAQWYSAGLETEGPRVRASSASLRCVLEQDTFIIA